MLALRSGLSAGGTRRPCPDCVPSLFDIFFGGLANSFRQLAKWRKQGLLGKVSFARGSRALQFEHLESRILLSADLTYAAPVGAALDATLRIDDAGAAPILRLIDNNNPLGAALAERLFDQDVNVTILGNDRVDTLEIALDQGSIAHRLRVDFAGGADGDAVVISRSLFLHGEDLTTAGCSGF